MARWAARVSTSLILHVALASSAYAHHSHFYDDCKRVTIEGQVERVEFKNPHNSFTLRLDDGRVYVVDWINVTWLTKAGIIGAAKQAVDLLEVAHVERSQRVLPIGGVEEFFGAGAHARILRKLNLNFNLPLSWSAKSAAS